MSSAAGKPGGKKDVGGLYKFENDNFCITVWLFAGESAIIKLLDNISRRGGNTADKAER